MTTDRQTIYHVSNPSSKRVHTIRYVGNNSYYDYASQEYFDFTISGNQARVCWEIGCNNIYRAGTGPVKN